MPDHLDSLVRDRTAPAGPQLHTTRLLLRPLEPGDAAAFHRLINDWDICRKLPEAQFPYPAELAAQWIAAASADRAGGVAEQFAVVDRERGALLGSAGLRLSRDRQSADLGYWLGRAYWGQGFGVEVARRLTEWAFAALPIARVTATTAADNDASAAVLQRLGFGLTAKGSQVFQCRPGQKLPVHHYAIEREVPMAAAAAPPSAVLLVVAVALIDNAGKILLARRPEGKKMAGMWEFPGGKVDPGETPEAALVRELREELGIEVAANDLAPFVFASHPYDNFHLLMPVFLCRRWQGQPAPKEGQALAWVAPDRLVEYPMPPADRPLIPMLRDFL